MQENSNTPSELIEAVYDVVRQFEYKPEQVIKATRHFRRQMKEGLQRKGTTLSQIPSYVTSVPTGREKGIFLAADLGGTNFRVCSVDLHGDNTYSIIQSKVFIPLNLMAGGTSHELFAFLSLHIQQFLEVHHAEHLSKCRLASQSGDASNSFKLLNYHRLGFTFSFTFEQESLSRGRLLKWTKGFDIPDMVGKEICSILQEELDRLHLPVIVTALVNDTVGALMARAYTSPDSSDTILGAIFGTGTNGAYVERLSKVTKMPESQKASSNDLMIINTEWGGFDDELSVLPQTPFDVALDQESVNPHDQHFEKLVSGMYLGEILRRTTIHFAQKSLFSMKLSSSSPLFRQWGVDTSLLSLLASNDTNDFRKSRAAIGKAFEAEGVTETDAEAIRMVSNAIGCRAARLAGVAIAAIIIDSGRLAAHQVTQQVSDQEEDSQLRSTTWLGWVQGLISDYWCRWVAMVQALPTVLFHRYPKTAGWRKLLPESSASQSFTDRSDHKITSQPQQTIIDVGLDGSLIELYPGFEEMIRSSIRDVPDIGSQGDRYIRFGLAKDGSGVGAALIAWAAMQQESR